MNSLTNKQKLILDYISIYVTANPCPPTIREIACHFGISPKGAYDHLKALEKKGYIRTIGKRSRSIELLSKISDCTLTVELEIRGQVAAGKPLYADDHFEGTISVPAAMVKNGFCYALKVRGDSMINAGILDGDIVVIEKKNLAKDGDIVVALMEDSVTLKRFYMGKDKIRLSPENPAYNSTYTQDVQIQGVLRGVIRTY